MPNLDEVESLFSQKASNWNQKYSPGGPLRSRLYAFEERLTELVNPPANVLDFGCGTGDLACYLALKGYTLTACDIAGKMVERGQQANAGTPIDWFILAVDWRELPLASNAFDAILASSVFEYLSDINRVFSECHRILKPGGFLIATIPNPKNLVRKLEKFFYPLMIAMSSAPLLKRVPKVKSYAAYLKCSRNRMSVDEWSSIGAGVNLVQLAPYGQERQKPQGNPPLVFLEFRKS